MVKEIEAIIMAVIHPESAFVSAQQYVSPKQAAVLGIHKHIFQDLPRAGQQVLRQI